LADRNEGKEFFPGASKVYDIRFITDSIEWGSLQILQKYLTISEPLKPRSAVVVEKPQTQYQLFFNTIDEVLIV
jgi:hypothetical protein